jgi:hypothetical protein
MAATALALYQSQRTTPCQPRKPAISCITALAPSSSLAMTQQAVPISYIVTSQLLTGSQMFPRRNSSITVASFSPALEKFSMKRITLLFSCLSITEMKMPISTSLYFKQHVLSQCNYWYLLLQLFHF